MVVSSRCYLDDLAIQGSVLAAEQVDHRAEQQLLLAVNLHVLAILRQVLEQRVHVGHVDSDCNNNNSSNNSTRLTDRAFAAQRK